MAAKKAKRPPRQVWLVLCAGRLTSAMFLTKREAVDLVAKLNEPPHLGKYTVAGPYVLAERVRER